jgi:hypothetical protein
MSIFRDRAQSFHNFMRQAAEYDAAAAQVIGTSAALLHYYSALNLAKAHLLKTNAAQVVGTNVGHGLSTRLSTNNTIGGDHLLVRPGIFPMLYEAITGFEIFPDTKLEVRRLLANVPEIGWELETSGVGTSASAGLLHAVVSNGHSSWAFVAVQANSPRSWFSPATAASRLFLTHFEEVTPPQNWQDVLAVSRRAVAGFRFFQSKIQIQGSASPIQDVCDQTFTNIGAIISGFDSYEFDAMITSGVYRSELWPMPGYIARYALLYYLSSLVRYRPEKLDPAVRATQAWLLEAFVEQSPPHSLECALGAIRGVPHRFLGSGYSRR